MPCVVRYRVHCISSSSNGSSLRVILEKKEVGEERNEWLPIATNDKSPFIDAIFLLAAMGSALFIFIFHFSLLLNKLKNVVPLPHSCLLFSS